VIPPVAPTTLELLFIRLGLEPGEAKDLREDLITLAKASRTRPRIVAREVVRQLLERPK
jgi:hypothetical protein